MRRWAASWSSDSNALAAAAMLLSLSGCADFGASAHLRHADVPPGVARRPCEGVGDDRDHGGTIGGLGPVERLPQIGKALDVARKRAHRFGMLGEVDREGLLHPTIFDEIVETRRALGVLQAV